MRAFVTAMLLTASVGCAQRAGVVAEEHDALPPGEVHHTESLEWAIATPRQRCYVEGFVENDLPRRDCMVPCILKGGAALIGGGCWHLCYAYMGSGVPSRRFFSHCPPPEPHPVPVPPSLSCTTDADRSIRVDVIDAETERPIERSRIIMYSGDERVQFDEVGHIQVHDPPDGPIEIQVFAPRYFPSSASLSSSVSLAVPEGNRCNVSFELMPTRGHGF